MNAALPLPVDTILADILASLERTPNLVIEAPPGAGKTTRVPPALLTCVSGNIIVLEPRRIAARLAARRVASELGEQVGETVGYQVRFDEAVGPRTRLRFVTEGILTRRFLSDPELKGVDAVVLDEFHERHLESDLALALLKQLQQRRPALKIVVMSATLDAGPIAAFLGACPILRSEGRLYEVLVRHLPYSPHPLHAQVNQALELLLREGDPGHILVFLPGAAEIRQVMRACEVVARRAGMIALPLHGDLSPAEQDRAVVPGAQRKLILATNVAESSVTVEGVSAVIDSGLARFATYSPWTGLPSIQVGRVSKASAKQRAGRAGRTGPGRVLRLYAEDDYLLRSDHDTPEIERSDLSQLCLTLRAMRVDRLERLEWLTLPPAAAITSAESLLDRLGAHGELAEQMAKYPLPPRLARLLLASLERKVGEDGCMAAALLGSGARSDKNDLLSAMDSTEDVRMMQQAAQLRRLARPPAPYKKDDDALLMAVLAGFPDRVARRRVDNQLLLSTGIAAELDGEPPAYEFMVAVDAEDRKEKPLPRVRMTARIEPEWLIELFPERVHEQSTVEWNRAAERVDAVQSLLYDKLVIHETQNAIPDVGMAAKLLAEKAMEAGTARFVDEAVLENLLARIRFAGLAEPDLHGAMQRLCNGLRSFPELKRAATHLLLMLEQEAGAQRLRELAPTTVRLSGGRTVKINYEPGKSPWIASRLQDFFGMGDTPRIGQDRVPLVVHLLAPNQRAVQTTTDLAGFWERLYPQVRKELMRRYPRHTWPEKP